MDAKSAIALVNQLIYRPGWTIEAVSLTDRFEGAICLQITYPTRIADRDQADAGYPVEMTASAKFVVLAGPCNDTELYRKVLEAILKVECHEAREFLRVHPTNWAPFHPHRSDGMARWGDPEGDLQFGVA